MKDVFALVDLDKACVCFIDLTLQLLKIAAAEYLSSHLGCVYELVSTGLHDSIMLQFELLRGYVGLVSSTHLEEGGRGREEGRERDPITSNYTSG